MPLSLVTAPAIEPLTLAEAKAQLLLGSSAGEPAPTAPTVALASPAAAGNCDNGAHRVGFTFVTADGETEIGPLSDVVTVADKTVNGQIAVTAIALGGASVTARKAYLVPVAGGAAKYAATLSDNTSTTLTLSVADSALGAEAPTTNTTVDPALTRWITAARERAELATWRALITQTWDLWLPGFPGDCFELPKANLQTVSFLKYVATDGTLTTLTPTTDYVVTAPAGPRARRGSISLAYGQTWPSVREQLDAVQIRFVCGYGASAASVPAQLRSAMLMDLATLYATREDTAPADGLVARIYRSYKSRPLAGAVGVAA